MASIVSCTRSFASRSLLLVHLTVISLVSSAATGLGKYDPCITAGHLSRVRTPPHHIATHAHSLEHVVGMITVEVFTLKAPVQGSGFYVGVAFWPGGTIEDWGPVFNAAANYTGLSPCESKAEYNATGLTHQQYLVRGPDIVCACGQPATKCSRETVLRRCRSVKAWCSGVMRWSWIA